MHITAPVASIVIGAIVLALLVAWLTPKALEWLAIDKCLDAGGAWDSSAWRCL